MCSSDLSIITALLTPLRLKRSDDLVAWWSRHAPRALTNYLNLYTEWLGQFGANRKPGLVGRMVRKWFWQMGLNVALTAAVFIVAAFLAQRKPAWLPKLPGGEIGLNAFLWLGATLLALPLLIYFAVMWTVAFASSHALGLPYARSATVAFTAAGNNFELAIAVAIGTFGVTSGQALAGVVGPLIEVPVLVSLVYVALAMGRRLFPGDTTAPTQIGRAHV